MERIERAGLRVDTRLAQFLEERALPGTGVEAQVFWTALSRLVHDFAPRNRALLKRREELQSAIDGWHQDRRGKDIDAEEYRAFLEEIGYLVVEGEPFEIRTEGCDPEIAKLAGPQLVVPSTNANRECAVRAGEHGFPVRVPITTSGVEPDPYLGGKRPTRAAVERWERERSVSRRVKRTALMMVSVSMLASIAWVHPHPWLPWILAGVMVLLLLVIVRLPEARSDPR